MSTNHRPKLSERAATAIAGAITIVWVISSLADIVSKEYEMSPFVHIAMMGVAGAIFGHGFFPKGNGGKNAKA